MWCFCPVILVFYASAVRCLSFFFFFFNDTATTEIYTLSLHDALPISRVWRSWSRAPPTRPDGPRDAVGRHPGGARPRPPARLLPRPRLEDRSEPRRLRRLRAAGR